jgi:hypothetical protein
MASVPVMSMLMSYPSRPRSQGAFRKATAVANFSKEYTTPARFAIYHLSRTIELPSMLALGSGSDSRAPCLSERTGFVLMKRCAKHRVILTDVLMMATVFGTINRPTFSIFNCLPDFRGERADTVSNQSIFTLDVIDGFTPPTWKPSLKSFFSHGRIRITFWSTFPQEAVLHRRFPYNTHVIVRIVSNDNIPLGTEIYDKKWNCFQMGNQAKSKWQPAFIQAE